MAHRVFPEKIINFVHAKDDYKSTSTSTSREKKSVRPTLDGRDVKLFYEELVGSSSPQGSAVNNDTPESNGSDGCKSKCLHSGKRKHTSSDKLIRTRSPGKVVDTVGVHGNPVKSDGCDEMAKSEVIGKSQDSSKAAARRREPKFLLCAQDGNLKELCRLIEDGVDVNVCDAYGWTALMCASHAGHLPVIQYLVNHSARMSAMDDKGRMAVDIAKSANQRHVVKFYENVGQCSDLRVNKSECSPFYCDVCQVEFRETPKDAHNTSTVHLFNSGLKRKPTSYFLPESNKGFQMMLRSGWDKEKGLGSEEQGHKYPVKTVLKQDRQGLGTEAVGKARVTHFGPHDREAVVGCNVKRNMKTSTLNVRACERHASKEKRKERDFRMAFNMD